MRILLVEDDQSLSRAIRYRLEKEGFDVMACFDGLRALAALADTHFDMLLLDRMLPGADGVSILKKLRSARQKTPVLMLTAMDGIHDRVAGLDAGADDYLVKPFAMDEMMARIRALSRRQAQWSPQDELQAGDILLELTQCTLFRGEAALTLTPRETKLLTVLMRNAGQTLPRSVLLDRVWEGGLVEDGNLDIHIHYLRKRLAQLHSHVKIQTVRGVGYRLVGFPQDKGAKPC